MPQSKQEKKIQMLRDRKSGGGIIETHQKTPMGERHTTLFVGSTHWNKLSEHKKERVLDTLGLENQYSKNQIAKLNYSGLTKFWKKKLSEHGVGE